MYTYIYHTVYVDVVVLGGTSNSRLLVASISRPIHFHRLSSNVPANTTNTNSNTNGARVVIDGGIPCEHIEEVGLAVQEYSYYYYGAENDVLASVHKYILDCVS